MKSFSRDRLAVRVFETREEMGRAAAADFAAAVRKLLARQERIRVIFAAAPSQNDFLKAITEDEAIDFSRIDAFHMDEYVGLDRHAPQAFGQFLRDRLFDRREFHSVSYIDGEAEDPEHACREYAGLLSQAPIDIVCMGIGENGHIAFNDPGVADFSDPALVKTVPLDEVCRMQQVHDGCFPELDAVPTHALTLTVPALTRAEAMFCSVPAATKAEAVRRTVTEEISEACPATVMRRHPHAVLYCDRDSGRDLTTL